MPLTQDAKLDCVFDALWSRMHAGHRRAFLTEDGKLGELGMEPEFVLATLQPRCRTPMRISISRESTLAELIVELERAEFDFASKDA